MKPRRARQRKKVVASSSSHVEVWAAAGVCSGPSYEAFTIPTPRGLSTIGTAVDTSITGRKRPASDAEQAPDSASFGTLLQHVVVERGDVKDGAFACQQHSLVGGVGSARPSQQQASTAGVKQVVLRLSGIRRCPATLGEPSSVKYGESVMNMGTEAESQHQTLWSNNTTECTENMKNDHVMDSSHPDEQSGSQGATVKVLHPAFQIYGSNEELKENKRGCGDDSGGCMGRSLDKLGSGIEQAGSGFEQGQPRASFPHPSNPGWILNANVCRSCCVPPALNNQIRNPCNACAATRFTSFQQGVPRAVHYIPSKDVMVCPAPWVHEGRDESYQMPDPVYPPGHCNGFADDLDMETQRHLEEQIAQEILLLSQKLANLQARYGARRPVLNNTKPAVLSCPLTPLLLDITRRDVKSKPRAPSSSRLAHRQPPESRCQPEERKLGAGRTGGTNTNAAASTAPTQSSNRGSDSGVQATSSKSYVLSRAAASGQGNISTSKSRASTAAQNGCQPIAPNESNTAAAAAVVENLKPSKNSRPFATPHRKRRDRQPEAHVDGYSYSDDMREHLKATGGESLQGYPNGSKRFDWVKTLRIAGVRENQGCSDLAQAKPSSPHRESEELAPTSVSKSAQTSSVSTEGCFKSGRVDTVFKHSHLLQRKSGIGDVQESVKEDFRPAALKATTAESESRLKRRPDSSSTWEHRPGKNGKRTLFPEEMGVLDSRINYHLLKAGMRRAPSLRNALRMKKKTFGSRSPRKDGGKRLRSRTLLDLNLKAFSAKVVEKPWPPCLEAGAADVPWPSEGAAADCEAEYETFVENTVVGGCEEEDDASKREGPCREEEGDEEESQTRSCVFSSPEKKDKLPEAPVLLSLVKTSQVPKKTFIRCIDLVVASSKESQVSKCSNGRTGSGVRNFFRRVACSESPVPEGCQTEPQVEEGAVMEQALAKLDMDDESREPDPPAPRSTGTTTDTKDSLVLPELAPEDASSSSAVVSLASVLSRVIPKQMESMDAAQLRARWEELIDALEKERLGLPKIKTCVSSSTNCSSDGRKLAATAGSSSSPRDSGGVKRIAQQLKSASQDHHHHGGQGQKDQESLAPDDVSLARARPLWSKVEQKQELVF